MERRACRDDRVVAPLDQGDQAGFQWHVRLTRQICHVTGDPQKSLHSARPVFLLDLDQGLQLTQVMGVAQRVQHAAQRVVRLPVVMHNNAGDALHQAAAFR